MEIHFNGDLHNFETLLEQKAEFNRPNFRIFFCGFEFDEHNLPEDAANLAYYSPTPACIRFIREHLSRFVRKEQVHVRTFDFNAFADCFAEGIPEVLVRRLVNLRNLTVSRAVQDVDQLVKILKIVGRRLNDVQLVSSSLDQVFFDLRPTLCPVLGALGIKQRTQLNPAFLLQFESLINVSIYQELPTEIVKAALAKYELLVLVSFFYEDYRVRLSRLSDFPINFVLINEDNHFSLNDRDGPKKGKSRIRAELISEFSLDHLKCNPKK